MLTASCKPLAFFYFQTCQDRLPESVKEAARPGQQGFTATKRRGDQLPPSTAHVHGKDVSSDGQNSVKSYLNTFLLFYCTFVLSRSELKRQICAQIRRNRV